MRILVTGARGFIGRHLTRELEAAGLDVTGVDLADGDLTRDGVAASLIASAAPDVVVHLAAQVGRLFGEDDIAASIRLNALMTANVAQATSDAAAHLVYCSTSEVYGDQGDAMCWEGGPEVLPHGMYGLSKRWGEEAARLYAPRGLQIMRLSMPYGPGLPAGRGRAALINFLWNAAHGEELTVHDGGRRAWCWIGDTVAAFRIAIEDGEWAKTAAESGAGVGVYNIGRDDNETPMLDVARMACRLVDAPETLIRVIPAPERQTIVKRLSTEKIRGLGWTPQTTLEEGMAMTWAAIRDTYTLDGMPVAA